MNANTTAHDALQVASPDTERAQHFWGRYFSVYDKANESAHYRAMLERHIECLQPGPDDTILDAGTGTGNVAEVLLGSGAEVIGIDFLESGLDVCRDKCPRGDFRFGDLTGRLDFEDARFDKAACCNVIYLLEPADQLGALSEIHRVLKPGGRAAVTVFHRDFSKKQLLLATLQSERERSGWLGMLAYLGRNAVATTRILYYISRLQALSGTGRYTFFTDEQLKVLLERAGFEVESIEPTLASQCLLAIAKKPESA